MKNCRSDNSKICSRSETANKGLKTPNSESQNNSKKTSSDIEPRITRRMTKLKNYYQSVGEKCVICLGDYIDGFGKLTCGHIFCFDCVIQWWRNHPNCPFCREEIILITKNNGSVVRFEDIPPIEKNEKD